MSAGRAAIALIAAMTVSVAAIGAGRTTPATHVVERYGDGSVKRDAEMRDGRLDGVVRGFFENGAPEYVRTYRQGREAGVHRGWYANGAPRFVYHYRDGVSEGEQRQWYSTGQPLTWFNHLHGQESGLQRMWNPDSTIRSSYVVRDGRRYGLVGAVGCTGRDRDSLEAEP